LRLLFGRGLPLPSLRAHLNPRHRKPEAPDGGWGLTGHANTNEELVAAARAQIAALRAGQPAGG
jgi:hypothetical protein